MMTHIWRDKTRVPVTYRPAMYTRYSARHVSRPTHSAESITPTFSGSGTCSSLSEAYSAMYPYTNRRGECLFFAHMKRVGC